MRAPRRRGAAAAILAVGCWCHQAAGTPTSSPSSSPSSSPTSAPSGAAAAAAAAAGGTRELPTGRRLQAPASPTPSPTEYDPFRPTEWPTTARPTTAWPTLSLLPTTAPTVSSAPTAHEYQDNLVAYYPMTQGKLDDAHASKFHGKAKKPEYPESDIMVAADLRQTEARDGPEGDAVALNNSKHIELPDNVTRSISGDRPRTVCLWARIDKWKNKARIFEYGRKAPQGELFGLRTWNVPGEFAVEMSWNVRNHWDNRHVVLSTNVSMVPAPTPMPFESRRLDGAAGETSFPTAAPTPQSPWVKTWHHYCMT